MVGLKDPFEIMNDVGKTPIIERACNHCFHLVDDPECRATYPLVRNRISKCCKCQYSFDPSKEKDSF